jgi:hypothetical protein
MARRQAKPLTERDEVHALVFELFDKIQTAQGMFHVSDGEVFDTKAEFFERVRGRLAWGRRACEEMRAFLKKHGELRAVASARALSEQEG